MIVLKQQFEVILRR